MLLPERRLRTICVTRVQKSVTEHTFSFSLLDVVRGCFFILSMLENLVEKLLLKAIATIPEAHETTRVIHGLLPCCRRAVSKSDFHKATLAWALELAPDNVY